ncbi:hypothetical protein VTO73DRAFT_9515 [Trametes versicolor]
MIRRPPTQIPMTDMDVQQVRDAIARQKAEAAVQQGQSATPAQATAPTPLPQPYHHPDELKKKRDGDYCPAAFVSKSVYLAQHCINQRRPSALPPRPHLPPLHPTPIMSLPATLPVLPIEVIEHALDYLRGDRKTLATCRLVCRAWSARARYNLFYIVKICLTNAVRFFAAVEHDPDAAYAMHELTLEAMWDNPKGASPYLGTANLRTLRLSIMDLHSPWLPRVMQCATHSLTELSMRTCAIADTHQLVRFLQLLPRLKHFAGTHLIITAHDDTPEKYPIEAFPALQSLCLLGDCSRGVPLRLLCAFASASGGLKSMSVLTIKLRTHELATFNDLLVLVAANLRELVLTVQPDESETLPDGSGSPLSLSTCRRLSSLKLNVWLRHPGPPTHSGHLNWVVDFFASIRSDNVRLVQLAVRANRATPGDLAKLDWGGVDRVLSLTRFASLRSVVVRVTQVGADLKIHVEPYVRTQMVAMAAKGILRDQQLLLE